MRIRALCPICCQRLPRLWFVKRKFRPCPRCATLIRTIGAPDRFWSIFIGAVTAPFCIAAGAIVGAFLDGADGFVIGVLIGCAIAFPLGSLLGFYFFPYFAPFEPLAAFPVLLPSTPPPPPRSAPDPADPPSSPAH